MILFFLVFIGSSFILFCIKPLPILKISTSVLPNILGKILIVSFAIITFVFGIHSDIFSSYNKYMINLESQYNWLFPIDIVNFPFDQYLINTQGKYPENIIDFSKGLEEDYPKRKIVILLDKTGSITNNEEEIKKKEIKDELFEYLGGTIDDFEKKVNDQKIEIQDLYLLTALEKLTKDEEIKKTHIEVLIYAGTDKKGHCIEKIVDESFDDNKDENRGKRKKIILSCLTYLIDLNLDENQKKINARYTDFHGLANELKQPKFLGDGLTKINGNGNKYDHLSLFFLSDFFHEEARSDKSVRDVEKAWSGMGDLISQLNLILFDNSQKDKVSKYISGEIKEIFKKNFNHLYFFEFNEYFSNKLSTEDKISVMFSSVHDAKIPKPLVMYHSWNKQEYKYDYRGEVKIVKKNKKPDLIFGFANRIRPKNYVNPYNYLIIEEKENNQDRVKLYKHQKDELPGGKEENYEVTFLMDEIESKNFFLEFTYPNIGYTIRHPIVFKPVLSKTSCVYLIIMYSLFIISFCHINYYFLRSILKQDDTTRKFKILYSFIFGVFLIVSFYLIGNLIFRLISLGGYHVYMLVGLMVLSIIFGFILCEKIYQLQLKRELNTLELAKEVLNDFENAN